MRNQPLRMDEAPQDLVLEYRYDLYSRAHQTLRGSRGANALMRLYAEAKRCRRAAELVTQAEEEFESGFPRLAIEHLDPRCGACSDCVRSACLTADELGAVPQPLVA